MIDPLKELILSDEDSVIFQEGLRQGRLEERAAQRKPPRPDVSACKALEQALKEIARATHAKPERLREIAASALIETGLPLRYPKSPKTGSAT